MMPAASVVIRGPSLGRLLGSWTLDPSLLAVLLALAVAYAAGARRVRGWPPARTLAFSAGLAVLAAALLSGIDAYADELLSIHMVQHILLLLVAPVLLLWAAPVRLALAAGGPGLRRAAARLLHARLARVASRPAFGVTALSVVVLATQFTGIFELSLRDPTVHAIEHAAYFWAGMLCFAPLVAADPLPRPPGPLARFSWLMVVMTVMVAVGVVFTYANTLRYPYYAAPARALHASALADQQLAGIIMWFGGGLLGAALALALVIQALVAEERRPRRRDRYSFPESRAAALDAERPESAVAP
jgi:putative membrane protein